MATIYIGTKIYPDTKKYPEKIMNLTWENILSMSRWIMGFCSCHNIREKLS
jgi:hypothetical protein